MGVCMDVRTGVQWAFVWVIDQSIDCMGVRTGDRVDVCRAVRRAVCRAVRRAVRRDDRTAINRMGVRTANSRTLLVY